MRGPAVSVVTTIVLISVLIFLLGDKSTSNTDSTELMVYCAAVIMEPVEVYSKLYDEEFNTGIQLQYGGSGTLLSNLEISRQGDIYIAAASSYTDIAREKGLVNETFPLGEIQPVIVVAKGNPKKIKHIEDLLSSKLRLSLANPDTASIGKTTKEMLEKMGIWDKIHAAVQKNGVFKPTVSGVANDVRLGITDAAIIWDVTAEQYDQLEIVPIPESKNFIRYVTIGILTHSENHAEAVRFARFLSAHEKDGSFFRNNKLQRVPEQLMGKTE